MAAISLDPRHNIHVSKNNHQHGGSGGGVVVEEIEGLIRVYKDGHIERPPIVPNVSSCSHSSELGVTSKDVIIDKVTNLWVRFYVPSSCPKKPMPLLVYFHGGGFCVGSASWACYHNFLVNLSSKACCVIVSVNYRLAPENRLPVPYEDGFNVIMWLKQQALISSNIEHKWWLSQCHFSSLFLAGDSAGANIAYHVATRLGSIEPTNLRPFCIKGMILIQPFFGGESYSESEKYLIQPMNSALNLSSSDTYWRLSLPLGANRDHPWCNPLAKGGAPLRLPSMMVCVSDLDILKDRNIEFCNTMANAGKRVEKVIYKGVGHAFQVLNNSQYSQPRTHEMMSHLKAFINQ